MVLTKAESMLVKSPLCCECEAPVSSQDVAKGFDARVLEFYKELKEYREQCEYEEEIIVEANSKDIRKLEREMPFVENVRCSACNEAIRKSELFILGCSHEYHRKCLENCIQVLTLGRIFLTRQERKADPTDCIVCHQEIDDETVEQVFENYPEVLKRHREKREQREKGCSAELVLSCCNRGVTMEDVGEKLEGVKFFSKSRNKVVTCLCPYCNKPMAIADILLIFDDEMSAILSTICASCMEPLESKKVKATCKTHYFCNKCSKKKECSICSTILHDNKSERLKGKRTQAEDSCGITCAKCKSNSNPLKGTLLHCYHFLCEACASSKKSQRPCPICKKSGDVVKVRCC